MTTTVPNTIALFLSTNLLQNDNLCLILDSIYLLCKDNVDNLKKFEESIPFWDKLNNVIKCMLINDSTTVAESLMRTMRYLCDSASIDSSVETVNVNNILKLMSFDCSEQIVKTVHQHITCEPVVEWGCALIRILSFDVSSRNALAMAGSAELVNHALEIHGRSNAGVVKHGSRVFGNLSNIDEVKIKLFAAGAYKLLIRSAYVCVCVCVCEYMIYFR